MSILQKIPEIFCLTILRKIRKFSEHWGHLSWHCPSLKILSGGCGVVRLPGSPENAGRKGPRFDSRRILLDIGDEGEGAHEDDKNVKDADYEDENDDEFEKLKDKDNER